MSFVTRRTADTPPMRARPRGAHRRHPVTRAIGWAACTALLIGGGIGCVSPSIPAPWLPPLTMQQAVGLVNANNAAIQGTMRAIGTLDGSVVMDDGRRQRFSLDGVMFYLPPLHLRLDLKKFGERHLLIGSNEASYWFFVREEDRWYCGRHGEADEVPEELPITPNDLVDALGLSAIPWPAIVSGETPAVHRVEDEVQQVLFLSHDNDGRLRLQKEYWLERASPRLIRRVVFRDHEGRVELESTLGNYVQVASNGPWLPRTMEAWWPSRETRLVFEIRRWELFDQVKADGPQFATPSACDGQ